MSVMTTVDLRSTYGWHLSTHARTKARERGVATKEILAVVANPDLRYTAENYGPGREVLKRGDLAVVTAPATKTVITVLWNTPDSWTSTQFKTHLQRARNATAALDSTGIRAVDEEDPAAGSSPDSGTTTTRRRGNRG